MTACALWVEEGWASRQVRREPSDSHHMEKTANSATCQRIA